MLNMRIKIRDWDKHFEADRSRQWKNIKWVPIPNKQGLGYKKIMAQKDGATIFGCWIALVEQGSICDPRGDLSKYTIDDLSMKTMIPINTLTHAIDYILQNLDWFEVVENLDINVNGSSLKDNKNDKSVNEPDVVSSILSSSILSSRGGWKGGGEKTPIDYRKNEFRESLLSFRGKYTDEMLKKFFLYWSEPNKSRTKMRFELEKTWEISRRLVTWSSRDKNFEPQSTTTQYTPMPTYDL